MKIKIKTKDKYFYLEGLRGVLAIIVIVHHFVLLFTPKMYIGSFDLNDYVNKSNSLPLILANTPLNIFMNGNFAVCLFFTLSGFVLSQNYSKTYSTKILQEAFFKRYFRLAIPILAANVLVFIMFKLKLFSNVVYPRGIDEYSFGKNLFLNDLSFFNVIKMSLFNVLVNGDNTYLPILWTMGHEFFGALLLFSFFFISHNLKKLWIFFILIFFISILMEKNYILLFFIGSFLAYYELIIINIFKHWAFKFLFLLLGLYFSGIPNIDDKAKQYTLYFYTCGYPKYIYLYFHILACTLLFLFIITSSTFKKLFSISPLVFFGKLSFSLYLIHLPLLFIVGTYFLNRTGGSLSKSFLFLICFSCCVIVAILFNFFVDKKSIKLSTIISKKIIDFTS